MSKTDQQDAVILLAIALDAACAELAENVDAPVHLVKTHQLAKAYTLNQVYSASEKAKLLTDLWQLLDSVLPPDELA
jgi:hypothetical protein